MLGMFTAGCFCFWFVQFRATDCCYCWTPRTQQGKYCCCRIIAVRISTTSAAPTCFLCFSTAFALPNTPVPICNETAVLSSSQCTRYALIPYEHADTLLYYTRYNISESQHVFNQILPKKTKKLPIDRSIGRPSFLPPVQPTNPG